jgi:hypothetical protein
MRSDGEKTRNGSVRRLAGSPLPASRRAGSYSVLEAK